MAKKKKAPEAEKESGERWLVSYADFVTLLLGVFIIMYSMAAADAENAGSSGANQATAIAAIAGAFSNSIIELNDGTTLIDINTGNESLELSEEEKEEQLIEKFEEEIGNLIADYDGILDLEDSIEIIIDEIGIHIRIKDTVLFESAKYEITPKGQELMYKIGNLIKEFTNNKIQVQGHTDNLAMNDKFVKSNWELGALRAVTVTKMFIKECSLNPKNLCAITYGEFQPLEPNRTAEGRAANRRVEITILRNYIDWDEL